MELIKRIRIVADVWERDKKSFAANIGMNQQEYDAYFSPTYQGSLLPLLDAILIRHPEVSRDWLYFGKGRSSLRNDPDDDENQDALDELSALWKKLVELEDELRDREPTLRPEDFVE